MLSTKNGILFYNASSGATALGRLDSQAEFMAVFEGAVRVGWTDVGSDRDLVLFTTTVRTAVVRQTASDPRESTDR